MARKELLILEEKMKDLMKSNIYESGQKFIVIGSCLKSMQPKAFEKLEALNLPIFDVCLEQAHINMVITKLLGMIRAGKAEEIIFATVDKSPHCVQMHYIQDELNKLGFNLKYINYVAVDDELHLVDSDTISLSKNLFKLSSHN